MGPEAMAQAEQDWQQLIADVQSAPEMTSFMHRAMESAGITMAH